MFPAVNRQGEAVIEIDCARSAWELIGATFALYRRYPWLFLVLAGAVVVPYELILLATTGNGPYAQARDGFVVEQILFLITTGVMGPLVSALHVHAVREIRDGNAPRLGTVAKRSLAVLPVAGIAVVISFIGATLGLIALIVPGVLLFLRWAVVAQAAALEPAGWKGALRRSAELTKGNYEHIFGLYLLIGVILFVPDFFPRRAFGTHDTTVASFLVGTAIEVLLWSFGALAGGLLFFDLKARLADDLAFLERETDDPTSDGRPAGWYVDPSTPSRMRYWAADGTGWSQTTAKTPKPMLREWRERYAAEPGTPAMATEEHVAHSFDPGVYSDEGRPAGWYVDPDSPWRMRYWHAGEHQQWSKETTKTPERIQAEWRDLRWRR
jgi:hypothetical protein